MSTEFGTAGRLAKVKLIDESDHRVFFDFNDGRTGNFTQTGPDTLCFSVGDVILVDVEGGEVPIQKVPDCLWPDFFWIGVVRLKLDDITVIESGNRLRKVTTKLTPEYEVDNTVEASDFEGVVRVLSEQPVKSFDLPTLNDDTIASFEWKPPEDKKLSFEDFGGLKEVVRRARELIEVQLLHRSTLSEIGVRPIKGVLFTGPPGTGKTMLAQIIAATTQAKFFKISGPEIFSKWVGQSEELLRRLFDLASQSPSIVFFDEIDSVAAERGDNSHESSKRVVAQLLTLMDGFTSDSNVVVIAATNRRQDLDPALRRPGRFDWEIEFPYPTQEGREEILAKSSRTLKIKHVLPHEEMAALTKGWSPAELSAIWTEAALLAVADRRNAIYEEDYFGAYERINRNRRRAGDK